MLTIDERQAKLEKIAGYSTSTLTDAKVRELRELAKGLVKNCKKLKQPQLANELLRLGKEFRDERLGVSRSSEVSPELSDVEDSSESAEASQALPVVNRTTAEEVGIKTYNKLKDIVGISRTSNDCNLGLEIGILVSTLVASEVRQYPAFHTRKNRRTTYLRTMAGLLRDETVSWKEDIRYAFLTVKEALERSWAEEANEDKSRYREVVEENKTSLLALDPRELLAEAKDILENPSRRKWNFLVKALAVATGRRPSELMVTASFKKAGEYKVEFTGLLKERRDLLTGKLNGKVEKPVVIPTLLPADLVIAGLEALEATGRRIKHDGDYITACDDSDRKYSSLFSQMMKGSGYKLKDMRKVYAVTCKELFKPKNVADNSYYKEVLAHDNLVSGDSYDKYYIEPDVKTELLEMLDIDSDTVDV